MLGEAQAHGNMGITKMNLCLVEEAIANFEAQLECLEAKTKVRFLSVRQMYILHLLEKIISICVYQLIGNG